MEPEIAKLNMDSVRFWVDLLQFLITAAVGVYVYLASRERVKTARINAMEKEFNMRIDALEKVMDARIDKHGERIAVVEAACTQAPSHQDLGGVYDRISSVAQKVDGLGGEMKATRRILDNIQQHLMKVGP